MKGWNEELLAKPLSRVAQNQSLENGHTYLQQQGDLSASFWQMPHRPSPSKLLYHLQQLNRQLGQVRYQKGPCPPLKVFSILMALEYKTKIGSSGNTGTIWVETGEGRSSQQAELKAVWITPEEWPLSDSMDGQGKGSPGKWLVGHHGYKRWERWYYETEWPGTWWLLPMERPVLSLTPCAVHISQIMMLI